MTNPLLQLKKFGQSVTQQLWDEEMMKVVWPSTYTHQQRVDALHAETGLRNIWNYQRTLWERRVFRQRHGEVRSPIR